MDPPLNTSEEYTTDEPRTGNLAKVVREEDGSAPRNLPVDALVVVSIFYFQLNIPVNLNYP